MDMAAAFISWPSAPLTESLVKRALSNLSVSIVTSLPASGTHDSSKLLQWSTYNAIDHDLTHRNPDNVLSPSHTIRKTLICKDLARSIHSYLTKHLDSVLKDAAPRTWDLEISYADEPDEMWSDQLRDLGNEIDGSSQWCILKPGMTDRGMGIKLFNSKDSLYQIFEEFEDQIDDTSLIISQPRHFVIQKYIPNPILLDPNEKSPSVSVLNPPENLQGHKFHLRAYFVASGALQLFMYDRVLALFAAVPYVSPTKREDVNDADPGNIDWTLHLTNTSLQIDRGEEGVHLPDELSGCHILSGDDTDCGALFTPEDIENIKVQMGTILAETFKAALEMPILQPLPNAFKLYGVDFLVSHDPTGLDSLGHSRIFQVKLLEINSKPAFEPVAVLPFFRQEVRCVPSMEVPVVPRNLRMCHDTKVRESRASGYEKCHQDSSNIMTSAHVNESVSKKDLKQVKQYLENMDPDKVEKTYGMGKYTPWHGDGKSQSKTNITFQTKSMFTSGEPPKYVTIVMQKGRKGAYVTYESSTWSDTAKTIIDEMIKAIKV